MPPYVKAHTTADIYRCRRTIAEYPAYQEHLGRLNALCDRNTDLLYEGTYRDTLGFSMEGGDLGWLEP